MTPPDGTVLPSGLCECGCGQTTPVVKQSQRRFGQYAGQRLRYIHGHNPRGKRAFGWKGGRIKNKKGYWFVWLPEHRLAGANGYVPEHRLIWEEANGRELLPTEDVHHIDGDKGNNAPVNLQAIPHIEHTLSHRRDPVCRERTAILTRAMWAQRKSKH